MEKIIDYYDVLRVSYLATGDEIKEAYRTKVKETHPDSKTGDTEHFKLVKEAYVILSNEEKRKRYNDFLFNYSKINSPVNNYETVEVPPNKKTVSEERIPSKQKHLKKWTFLSLGLNIAMLVILLWGYNQYTYTQKIAAEIQTKLDNSENTLIKKEDDLKAVNYEKDLLQSDYNEYKEKTEKALAAVQSESEEPIVEQSKEDGSRNNPNGAITQGSTKEHVKKVMGTPSSLSKMPLGGETWWYGGTAFINFDANGLVEGWTDINGNVLKVQ
ncbi:DnaJ domain-containing protein [Neobacillus sp. YIM B06451]|uniref:DnaJ domain-containing protein n=1 Tax=Neobacillus sp. YIM B06451 TaxID=3070994 RepID=UPI002931AD03|nr:DnaJ domain-containing protein [Neobacillus sp. YIM B06451]